MSKTGRSQERAAMAHSLVLRALLETSAATRTHRRRAAPVHGGSHSAREGSRAAAEADFLAEARRYADELRMRPVRHTPFPGQDPPTREELERITAARGPWRGRDVPPDVSYASSGRLQRPCAAATIVRKPQQRQGQHGQQQNPSVAGGKREQALQRFRDAARAVVVRMRATSRLLPLREYLAGLGWDAERVAEAVNRSAGAMRNAAAAPAKDGEAAMAVSASAKEICAEGRLFLEFMPRHRVADESIQLRPVSIESSAGMRTLCTNFSSLRPLDFLATLEARLWQSQIEAEEISGGPICMAFSYAPLMTDAALRQLPPDEQQQQAQPQPPMAQANGRKLGAVATGNMASTRAPSSQRERPPQDLKVPGTASGGDASVALRAITAVGGRMSSATSIRKKMRAAVAAQGSSQQLASAGSPQLPPI